MSRHTHIIGIGGAAMNAMARLLTERGERISGCDRLASPVLVSLNSEGIQTFVGHDAAHLVDVDRVLITSALAVDHSELRAAREQGLPIITRHDLWGEWSLLRPTIAVSGTHGKTTTSAMTTVIFKYAGRHPGYLIGAFVPALNGNAAWGEEELIIEADEYARTFLALHPKTVAVTNIDWDHVDIYDSQASYDAAFAMFLNHKQVAHRILCGDDEGLRRVAEGLPAIWCGLGPSNDWQATQVRFTQTGSEFVVKRGDIDLGHVQLNVPGLHNVRNALLALAIAVQYGIDFATAAQGLAQFSGSARRFEYKGTINGVTVVDDYAHHPTEIQATLAAARSLYPQQRLVVYFQPHTFSRLQAFIADFATVFNDADLVCIGDVYGARESSDVNAALQLVQLIQHAHVQAVGSVQAATEHLLTVVQLGDVVLTLGAGDSVEVAENLIRALD